jgi:hypothetical protein
MRKLIGSYAIKGSAKAQPQGKQFRSSGDRDEAVTAMTGPFFSFFEAESKRQRFWYALSRFRGQACQDARRYFVFHARIKSQFLPRFARERVRERVPGTAQSNRQTQGPLRRNAVDTTAQRLQSKTNLSS